MEENLLTVLMAVCRMNNAWLYNYYGNNGMRKFLVLSIFSMTICSCAQRAYNMPIYPVLNSVSSSVVQTGLSKTATILDYCGIGGWTWLAGRALLKAKCPRIQKADVLQSCLQKFLSNEWLAFGLTACAAGAFIQLGINSPIGDLIISIFGGGMPAFFGCAQFAFDIFKGGRGLLRCCGYCQKSQEVIADERRKLCEYYEAEKKKIDAYIEEFGELSRSGEEEVETEET
ncbi:MAG: hypothetical protein LBD17_03165 [Endomicrobium sp.]|jgi:hypothetical protein|nr:hypothetical protein [Endomicrobium sp.]